MIRGESNHLLFQDEISIRSYQSLVNTWFPKGKQRIIPIYGNNKSVKIIGLLNDETGTVHLQEEECYMGQYLFEDSSSNNVLKQYPTGKMVTTLDHARIHHAKPIQPFLENHKSR